MIDYHGILIRSHEPFATGTAEYLDAHPGWQEPQPRIYVKVQVQGVPTTFLALLDTGGHYCILNAEIAAAVRDHLTDSFDEMTLRTAHGPVGGELHRHKITLVAEIGEPLDVEASLFIAPNWQAPSFLWYSGVLERIHFAVDPQTNRFYFGPMPEIPPQIKA